MAEALLTIDLGALRANWQALAALAPSAETAAVVKADAYGIGLGKAARALAGAGARTFFAALPSECLALRATLGPGPVIYCLNGLAEDDAAALREGAIRPVLNSPEQVRLARDMGTMPCAIQIDSGMNRLGLEAAEVAALFAGPCPLDARLVMSHLACADDPVDPMNESQRKAFAALTSHPRLAALPRSLAATGGIMMGEAYHHALTRPGIGLYGGLPFARARPVVTLTVPVLQVRDVAVGESVGYGNAWTAARPSRIATIGAGYADGLIRAMGNRAAVMVEGRTLPVVGRVSMDLVTLDATDAPDLQAGDSVEVLGAARGVDRLAEAAGTIGYEILTSLGTRYRRRYVG
jgi:alanine racemase